MIRQDIRTIYHMYKTISSKLFLMDCIESIVYSEVLTSNVFVNDIINVISKIFREEFGSVDDEVIDALEQVRIVANADMLIKNLNK